MSDIVESYKDTIISNLGNAGTSYLLLHIVQCCRACAVDKDNQALPMALYCSCMTYKYYSCIGFLPIKHNEEVK